MNVEKIFTFSVDDDTGKVVKISPKEVVIDEVEIDCVKLVKL